MDRTDREQRFTALASAVGEPVRRYVVRRGPPDLVDDVMSEVFLVLWRRLDGVPAEDPLPWSYAVARRCLANARRGVRRQAELVEKVIRLSESARTEAASAPDAGRDELLHEALGELSDLDREVVRLWAWEQLAPREIAAVLDLTPNAASLRLSRARRRLAARLRQDGPSAGHRPGDGRRR